MARRLLFLALLVGACGPAPERAGPAVDSAATAARPAGPREGADAPHTPFDAAEVVFDTTEPPEQVVQIPPRPTPAPRAPIPRPSLPPAPPSPSGAAGRCDVRATEGFCFAYTGDEWTPAAARTHCDAAPDAAFAAGTCPTEDRIATCTFERESAPGREIVYTYYAPYDPTLAALACPGAFERVE